VSQSGNLITSLLRIGETQGLGFRWVVSSGNEADLGTLDFLEAFDTDPETRVILSYLEGVKNGQDFFRRVRPIGQRKPLLMLKAGQTEAGARAARSHTGSLSGTDPIFLAFVINAGSSDWKPWKRWLMYPWRSPRSPFPRGAGSAF
jgi:acyl-CoA synthetase (NDP forming)